MYSIYGTKGKGASVSQSSQKPSPSLAPLTTGPLPFPCHPRTHACSLTVPAPSPLVPRPAAVPRPRPGPSPTRAAGAPAPPCLRGRMRRRGLLGGQRAARVSFVGGGGGVLRRTIVVVMGSGGRGRPGSVCVFVREGRLSLGFLDSRFGVEPCHPSTGRTTHAPGAPPRAAASLLLQGHAWLPPSAVAAAAWVWCDAVWCVDVSEPGSR